MTTYASFNPGDDSDLDDEYPIDAEGGIWIRPWTTYGLSKRRAYRITTACNRCGVYGHPCDCEPKGPKAGE